MVQDMQIQKPAIAFISISMDRLKKNMHNHGFM